MAGPLPPLVGGMSTVIDDLSRSSLAREVDLVLFDTRKPTRAGRHLVEALWARLRLWRAWWTGLGGTGRADRRRTIAHIHTCSGLSFFLDTAYLLLARLRQVPVVLHVHGAGFDAFLAGLGPIPGALARWAARRAARVVVLSEEWRCRLAPRLPGACLAVIENGIAALPTVAGTAAGADGTIRVLFLGNLGRRKGVSELLQALATLPQSVYLTLAGGDEDPGATAAAGAQASDLGIDTRVRLAGTVTGPDKTALLRGSDLFALPSHAEGLPMALLEAMAAGLPVVTTPVGGIPSLIRNGENGLLVPAGSPDALAEALGRLAGDPELRRRLGDAGRRLVESDYGVERAAAAWLGLYRGLMPAAAPGCG
jgi:glycosyltransferase involved in cell wall biosynthesis